MTQIWADEIPSYMDIATEGPYLVGQNWCLPQSHPMAPIRGHLVSQTTQHTLLYVPYLVGERTIHHCGSRPQSYPMAPIRDGVASLSIQCALL